MDNKRLTLSRPPSATQAEVVVQQKLPHGGRKSVIVVRTTLEPDLHRGKQVKASNRPPAPIESGTKRASEVNRERPRDGAQKKADALRKQKQERTRRAIEKAKARRKKQQDKTSRPTVDKKQQDSTSRAPVDRTKTRKENLKEKVIQLYQTLINYKAPALRDQAKAKVLRQWLYDINTNGWPKDDRVRLEFALEVINAAAAGRQPPDIQVPDGGYFYWPTTKVIGLSGNGIDTPPQDLGVLRAMGYRVGLQGLDSASRCLLLARVYRDQLQIPLPATYLKEWGQPQTAGRLQKLAHTLASLTRNQKRKQRPSQEAVEQWQADLEFLRISFYVGRYDFKWPNS